MEQKSTTETKMFREEIVKTANEETMRRREVSVTRKAPSFSEFRTMWLSEKLLCVTGNYIVKDICEEDEFMILVEGMKRIVVKIITEKKDPSVLEEFRSARGITASVEGPAALIFPDENGGEMCLQSVVFIVSATPLFNAFVNVVFVLELDETA